MCDDCAKAHNSVHTTHRLTQERLSRKHTELEHIQKRMATLASVRPPHMAEMEALQVQLQELFTQYASRFRNLQYMRLQLDLRRDAEREAMAEADRHRRRLLRRLKKEELRILRGEVRPTTGKSCCSRVAGWEQRRRQRQQRGGGCHAACQHPGGQGLAKGQRSIVGWCAQVRRVLSE